MSPRRRIQPGEEPLLIEQVPKSTVLSRRWKPRKSSRNWAPPLAIAASALLATGTLVTSAYFAKEGYSEHKNAMKEVDVLDFVKSFMTGLTTVDPDHANANYDRILAHATGDFAKQYRDNQNEILVHIAQYPWPTKGNTLAAGVERWNDDGSANVMVATDFTVKSPDGKQKLDITNRWVVTAQREGNQWKISSLQQVI